jgi:hypothetical protein
MLGMRQDKGGGMTNETRALIEAAEEALELLTRLGHKYADFVSQLEAAISSAKAAEEGVEDGWIDVDKELPPMKRDRGFGPCSDRVLVCSPLSHTYWIGVLNRPEEHEPWWMEHDGETEIHPSYWKPLREPVISVREKEGL